MLFLSGDGPSPRLPSGSEASEVPELLVTLLECTSPYLAVRVRDSVRVG